MYDLINSIKSGGVISQSLFLMICSITFVFAVQVIFYLFVKLWPKGK